MNDYDTPEIRCSLRNLSRVTECKSTQSKHIRQSSTDSVTYISVQSLNEAQINRGLPNEAEFVLRNRLISYARATDVAQRLCFYKDYS